MNDLEKSSPIRMLYVLTSDASTVLVRGQTRYLREAGYEVSLACAGGARLEAAAESEGVRTHAVPMAREIGGLADVMSLWRLWLLMRRERPVITNVGTPKAGLLGGIAAYLSGVPCRVYTLRGLRCETARGLKRRVLLLAERVACRCAHRVICVSESLREKAVALGVVDAERTVVLGAGSSNGVDAERFAPGAERMREAEALRRELGIAADAPVIGFVGRFTRDKGMNELVEAFKQVRKKFPKARLLLVGDFDEGNTAREEMREAIRSDVRILCTGTVGDTAPYYHVMDLLALPTHREGFPNAVLEAHAAGKAVVTTNATGAVDAVTEGVTGIRVERGNAGALGEALSRLLGDREMAKKMGQAGRERVRREFRREKVWKALEGEYRKLLREKGLPPPAAQGAEELQAMAAAAR